MAKQKIGLYWGTFDPPTKAHFNIMLNAIKQGKLDKLIIVVNDLSGPKHYHTPGKDRAAMIRKMLWDNNHQQPIAIMQDTPIEIIVQTDNYKVDDKLVAKMNEDAWVVPVVGQDSFVASAKYCTKYEEVIVAPRGENEDENLKKTIKEHNLTNIRILSLESELLTVSSTKVRGEVSRAHEAGKTEHGNKEPQIDHLVTPSTASYIRNHYFFKDNFHAEHHHAARVIQQAWRKHKKASDLTNKDSVSESTDPKPRILKPLSLLNITQEYNNLYSQKYGQGGMGFITLPLKRFFQQSTRPTELQFLAAIENYCNQNLLLSEKEKNLLKLSAVNLLLFKISSETFGKGSLLSKILQTHVSESGQSNSNEIMNNFVEECKNKNINVPQHLKKLYEQDYIQSKPTLSSK